MIDLMLLSHTDGPALDKEEGPHASAVFVHRVRWHTGLSQSEFARTFRIDLERLQTLEDGAETADSALMAYLTVIDRAPDAVRTALNSI